RRDGHSVVVENHDEPAVHRPGIVHGLVSHAGAHRSVSDHANDMARAFTQIARHGHAEPRRYRGRAVGGAEGVIDALIAFCETIQSTTLPDLSDLTAPAEIGRAHV